MISLINVTEEHPYHGRKLQQQLASFATDGRYVNINICLQVVYAFESLYLEL